MNFIFFHRPLFEKINIIHCNIKYLSIYSNLFIIIYDAKKALRKLQLLDVKLNIFRDIKLI